MAKTPTFWVWEGVKGLERLRENASLALDVARSVSQGLKPALIPHPYAGTKVPAYLRNGFFSIL